MFEFIILLQRIHSSEGPFQYEHYFPLQLIIERIIYDFQWKKRMEQQKAVIKFKAAARIARVTHDLTNLIRSENTTSECTT